jgi:NAD(P)-dependent dehydrogenase (short-subunit alcohol dehydrogenase family)
MARILITGCSSGIGRATAVEMSGRGHEVIATARRLEALADLEVSLRLQLDVTDDASVRAAVEAAGGVDVLVNNAGYNAWGPTEIVPFDLIADVMDTTYFGSLRMIRAVLPHMRTRRSGHIVNVSSVSGRVCGTLLGPYCAAKHALEAISEVLRLELRPFGVEVTLVEPGATTSRFDQNRVMIREPDGPYGALIRATEARLAEFRSAGTSAEAVAAVIADSVSHPSPRLRWIVGEDAESIINQRRALSDEQWENRVIAGLGLEPAVLTGG